MPDFGKHVLARGGTAGGNGREGGTFIPEPNRLCTEVIIVTPSSCFKASQWLNPIVVGLPGVFLGNLSKALTLTNMGVEDIRLIGGIISNHLVGTGITTDIIPRGLFTQYIWVIGGFLYSLLIKYIAFNCRNWTIYFAWLSHLFAINVHTQFMVITRAVPSTILNLLPSKSVETTGSRDGEGHASASENP